MIISIRDIIKYTFNIYCLYKKDFYLQVVDNFKGEFDLLENNISYWWARQNFKVAQGEGLFTHNDIQKYGI